MQPGVSLLYLATVATTIRLFILPYAAHFRALGWRVDVAARGASAERELREAFDNVYDLPLSRSVRDIRGLTLGARAISQVLASQPDIVHVHTPIAAFMTRLAVRGMPRERRPAIVYTAHGFHSHRGGNPVANLLFLSAEKLAGRWTDRLVVINDEDYLAARRHRIVGPSQLAWMPGIGIDTGMFSRGSIDQASVARSRQALGVEADIPLFVAVGELTRNKRSADAVNALATMRHTEAHLALAGGGPERAHLEEVANRMGVGGRVHFTGFIQDVRPLVGGATALVLPSKREGLARSIMEALALEVPVVASTARGNRQLVGDDSGFVVPTGDVAALATKMDWLIDHPVEAAEMGRHGRERMVEHYDVGNLMQRHEQLYTELLASRGSYGLA
jgi:glycosyltransferase involved in cell wall biosynthesis